MRLLFTMTPSFDPNSGGVQRTTYKLGKYFTEQGITVAYYSLAQEGHIKAAYGTLYTAPMPNEHKNPENIKDLTAVLHKFQPDIVINQMPYERELREVLGLFKSSLGYHLLGCLRNSLFSFKSNARDIMAQTLPSTIFKILDNPLGITAIQFRHRLKHRNELKAIIDTHDYFILLTPPNRKELNFFVGDYKPEKVLAIPNSIPEVHDTLDKKEKIILHVGRINITQKRSDLLLDFWEQIHKELPDWRFVIVGDGPYFSTLAAELEQRDLPRITLEGFQRPERYYEAASIFMMPSAYEGFPNTMLEAQSYGCAPLAFDAYAALSWIVTDGENALLSPPFETQTMGQQAIDLAQNPDKLKSVQLKAINNAKQFTIDEVGKKWMNFFSDIRSNGIR